MDLTQTKKLFATNKLLKLVPGLRVITNNLNLHSLPHNLIAMGLKLDSYEVFLCPLSYKLIENYELIKASELKVQELDPNMVLALYELAFKPFIEKCNEKLNQDVIKVNTYLNTKEFADLLSLKILTNEQNYNVLHFSFNAQNSVAYQALNQKLQEYKIYNFSDDFLLIASNESLEKVYDLLCDFEKSLVEQDTLNNNPLDPIINIKVLIDSFTLKYNEVIDLNVGDALVLKHFCNNDLFSLKCANIQTTATYQDGVLKLQAPFTNQLNQSISDQTKHIVFRSLQELSSLKLQDLELLRTEQIINHNLEKAKNMQENEQIANNSTNIDNQDTSDKVQEQANQSLNLEDINLRVDCVLDSFNLPLSEVSDLKEGSCLKLKNNTLNDINIYINEHLCAKGKVIAINDQFALQITQITKS